LGKAGIFCTRQGIKSAGCSPEEGQENDCVFCHPYSAFERRSNENMNRLIRRFFPKGTNFDNVTKEQVAEAERWINHYPRRLLGWKSAEELFDKEIPAA